MDRVTNTAKKRCETGLTERDGLCMYVTDARSNTCV